MNTFSKNITNLLLVHDNNNHLDFRDGSLILDDIDESYKIESDFDEIIALGWVIKTSQGGPYTRIEMTPFGEKIVKEIFDVCKKFTQGT
jgi:hypothetical protein